MLSIAECPRCHERVRVPEIDGSAEVRCPWCGEAFELDEVTRNLPPLLEVITLPTVGEGIDDFQSSPIEIDYQLVDSHSDDVETGSSPFPERMEFDAGKSRGSHSSRSRSGRRRRRESPFVGFLKMAGGGVAGILIALLILQSLDRLPNLGFWPFLGPGTSLNPGQFWGTRNRDSSSDPIAQTEDNSNSIADDNRERPEPIDLGVPDFASQGPGEPAAIEPDIGDANVSAVAGTSAVGLSAVERATELLNEHIRSGNESREVATEIKSLLANVESGSSEIKSQLDELVDRLILEKRILRQFVEASKSDIVRLGDGINDETESSSLALMGLVLATDEGLSLTTSLQDDKSLSLLGTENFDDVSEGEIVLVVGTLERHGDVPKLSVRYGKSLSRN